MNPRAQRTLAGLASWAAKSPEQREAAVKAAGRARMAGMTPEQRSELGRRAAAAKKRKREAAQG